MKKFSMSFPYKKEEFNNLKMKMDSEIKVSGQVKEHRKEHTKNEAS